MQMLHGRCGERLQRYGHLNKGIQLPFREILMPLTFTVLAMDITTSDVALDQETDHAMANRVLRKIDRRLIPLLFTTYMFNFMDKTILSSASVFGLADDTVRLACL